jgi:hypothetical protein
MKRRNFVKSVAATGAGLIILPSGILSGKSPSDKLNIALIGAHVRGSQHYGALESENVLVGPAQMHPFNPGYFGARPGAGCLLWNMYHDFGSWQIGDMGSHTMDLAWNAIDAGQPTSAWAEGDPFNSEVVSSNMHTKVNFPANDWRGPITVEWYQGNLSPASPNPAIDILKIGHGAMFKGTKGTLIADFTTRMLIPERSGADMTYYKSPAGNQVAPPLGGFVQQWFNACKGNLKTDCDFDYAGRMIETLMLGLAAHQQCFRARAF